MPHAALLEQLVFDCFDEEQYEAAVELVDTALEGGWAPSGAVVRHVFVLSLCSALHTETRLESADAVMRPTARAVCGASALLTRMDCVFAHLPQRTDEWAAAAARVTHLWQTREKNADDVFAPTRLRLWADEVLVGAFADFWDVLARRPHTVHGAPLPPTAPEFWLECSSTDDRPDLRERGAVDGFGGPVRLTEGAWRTLDALVRVWSTHEPAFASVLTTGDSVYNTARAAQMALSFYERAATPDEDAPRAEPERLDIGARLYALLDRCAHECALADALVEATAGMLRRMPVAAIERAATQLGDCAAFVNGAYATLYGMPCSLRVVPTPFSRTTCRTMVESGLDLVEQMHRRAGTREALALYIAARACISRAAADTSLYARVRRLLPRADPTADALRAALDALMEQGRAKAHIRTRRHHK